MASISSDDEQMDLDGPSSVLAAGPSQRTPRPGVALHRVRFVDWAPSAVHALAFLPTTSQQLRSASSTSRGLLAIGRDNGNIDLCVWVEDDAMNGDVATSSGTAASASLASTIVAKGWVVDTTLAGSNPSKVDSLVFVLSPTAPYPTPRLFSTSGGAIVTEHFLPPHLLLAAGRTDPIRIGQELPAAVRKSSTLSGKSRTIPSHGGAVWTMAASPLGRHLAIGCEDGVVRIVDIADGRFEHLSSTRASRREGDGTVRGIASTMDRAKARVVSLAWGPPRRKEKKTVSKPSSDSTSEDSDDDDDEDDWEDTTILAGTTKSYALVWSITTGRVLTKLLVDRARSEQTVVWSVVTLPNGACVLGDSLGHVSFFDGRTYTLLPGAKFGSHGKTADVLSLCVGPDGKSVYSASVDQKVIEYALVSGGPGSQTPARWVVTGRRRLHAHDIRSLAVDPPYDPRAVGQAKSRQLPILVSGGADFHLVLTPASSPSQFTVLHAPGKRNGKAAGGKKGAADTAPKAHLVKSAKYDHINPISSTAVTTFADTVHRRVPFVPTTGRGSLLGGGSVVRICARRRWVVLRREKAVAIWRLPDSSEGDRDIGSTTSGSFTKVLEITAKVQTNVVCVELSDDGRFLLIADLFESKLFELQGSGDDVVPKRVRSFSSALPGSSSDRCPGCSAAAFTPDGARLVLATQPGSFLHVIELPSTAGGKCTLLSSYIERRAVAAGRAVAGRASVSAKRSITIGRPLNGHAAGARASDSDDASSSVPKSDEDAAAVEQSVATERTTFARIDNVLVSPDGQYFLSVDTAKRIHCYSLDTLHHRGALPSPAQQPTSIVFDPWQPSRLCCILPTNQVVLYDIEKRQTGGGRGTAGGADALDSSFVRCINQRLSAVRDNAIGGVWLSSTVFVVWGATFLCTARMISGGKEGDEDEEEEEEEEEEDGNEVGLPTRSSGGKCGKRAHPDDAASVNGKHGVAKDDTFWLSRIQTKYQPLLYVDAVASVSGPERELVVVERPYYDVARGLPPTWFGGAAYGT